VTHPAEGLVWTARYAYEPLRDIVEAPTNVYPWLDNAWGHRPDVEVRENPNLTANKVYIFEPGKAMQTMTYVMGRTASEHPADFVYFLDLG